MKSLDAQPDLSVAAPVVPKDLPLPGDALSRKWAEVCEVCEGLLLCGASALTPGRVASLGVTCVVSAAPELPDTPLPAGVAFRRVPLHDSPGADLLRHLDDAADAIHKECESGGRTLVHCVAGVSRSAALCLAYLVKHLRVPLSDAFRHLRARRPAVRPNSGFFAQLIEFERRQLGAASVRMVCHPTAPGARIPDLYAPEYQSTLQHYNRNFGRH